MWISNCPILPSFSGILSIIIISIIIQDFMSRRILIIIVVIIIYKVRYSTCFSRFCILVVSYQTSTLLWWISGVIDGERGHHQTYGPQHHQRGGTVHLKQGIEVRKRILPLEYSFTSILSCALIDNIGCVQVGSVLSSSGIYRRWYTFCLNYMKILRKTWVKIAWFERKW